MKFIIISDSHGDYNVINDIFYANQDADIFIHLGDFELPDIELHNYLTVRGNCDLFSSFPLVRDVDYGNFKIHLEHGNNIPFNDFDNYVLEKNVDMFLFGHTHKKFQKKIGNTYVFNPGSTSYPRDCNVGSYLIIKIDKNKNIKYEFKKIG